MKVIVPLSKDDIIDLQQKISKFLGLCSAYDSIGRIYAWSDLHRNLNYLLQEEEGHNFEFPSPHNPDRKEILKMLERL